MELMSTSRGCQCLEDVTSQSVELWVLKGGAVNTAASAAGNQSVLMVNHTGGSAAGGPGYAAHPTTFNHTLKVSPSDEYFR